LIKQLASNLQAKNFRKQTWNCISNLALRIPQSTGYDVTVRKRLEA